MTATFLSLLMLVPFILLDRAFVLPAHAMQGAGLTASQMGLETDWFYRPDFHRSAEQYSAMIAIPLDPIGCRKYCGLPQIDESRTRSPRDDHTIQEARTLPTGRSLRRALREIDKGVQGRGQLPAAGIVEIEARIVRAPIFEDTHQPTLIDQILDLSLKGEGYPGAVQRRLHRQVLFAERELPTDVDG